MLFELWGQPQYLLPYIIYGVRNGTNLVNDADTLPVAIGEDFVMARAKYYAYEWAEANKGDLARMSGPDYRFLMGAAEAEFTKLGREYRRNDRELVDNWIVRRQCSYPSESEGAYYNAYAGVASAGGWTD